MKVKALVSFAGALTMTKGEVAECGDGAALRSLLRAGYVEEAGAPEGEDTKPPEAKEVKSHARKRNNRQPPG
ncbi:MAG: hypothetical protein FWG28_08575 [Clostridiales bacterium]|nr:hypothetical protein [Clostridiales bacterium]